MVKKNERRAKFDRILSKNRATVSTPRKNQFYALVDVREKDNNRTFVVDGSSRSEAYKEARAIIDSNGLKATISGVYAVA